MLMLKLYFASERPQLISKYLDDLVVRKWLVLAWLHFYVSYKVPVYILKTIFESV